MKNKQKFINFLESLKSNGQDALVESVKQGFKACFEGSYYSSEFRDWSNRYGIKEYDYQLIGESGNVTITFDLFINPSNEAYSCPIVGKLLTKVADTHAEGDKLDVHVHGEYTIVGDMTGNYRPATRESPEEYPEYNQTDAGIDELYVNIADEDGIEWPEDPVQLVDGAYYKLIEKFIESLSETVSAEIDETAETSYGSEY